MRKRNGFLLLMFLLLAWSCGTDEERKERTVFLAGDSTVADYSKYADYMEKRYPMTGWGQRLPEFLVADSLDQVRQWFPSDSVKVDNRAIGGRSTKTFFQEGRWRALVEAVQPGDLVLIQFGHNDASANKPERFTAPDAYQEYLRLFVTQTRERGGIPILVTPVTGNHKWNEDLQMYNQHGDYPAKMKELAQELKVALIDLNELSMKAFTPVGPDSLGPKYFMNLEPGVYAGYPEGRTDSTHFNMAGAQVVAQLVFDALKTLQLPGQSPEN